MKEITPRPETVLIWFLFVWSVFCASQASADERCFLTTPQPTRPTVRYERNPDCGLAVEDVHKLRGQLVASTMAALIENQSGLYPHQMAFGNIARDAVALSDKALVEMGIYLVKPVEPAATANAMNYTPGTLGRLISVDGNGQEIKGPHATYR